MAGFNEPAAARSTPPPTATHNEALFIWRIESSPDNPGL
jgi:hypothetical protein